MAERLTAAMERQAACLEQQRLFPGLRVPENDPVLFGPTPMLPEICLEFRAALNGAADRWPEKFASEVLAMLKSRLATWQPSAAPKDRKMDMAVKALVEATLEYAQEIGDGGATDGSGTGRESVK